jgi:hypothetical protein
MLMTTTSGGRERTLSCFGVSYGRAFGFPRAARIAVIRARTLLTPSWANCQLLG